MESKAATAEEETSQKVKARVEAAKADAEARQDAFQASIREGQASAASHWEDLQASFRKQIDEIKSNIDAKQDAKEARRAMRRAEDAELYATATIDFALLALSEAEIAYADSVA
jgi:hypothetical protein